MTKTYYGYENFLEDSKKLCSQIKPYNPDAIVAIARGGVTLGHFLASGLNKRDFFTIASLLYDDTKKMEKHQVTNIPDLSIYSSVLLVDDIVDSGETLQNIKDILQDKFPKLTIKTASLFYKTTAIIQADYSINEAHSWIEFFWEKDI
jgi:xanthine phosphoribosyltransferase